MTSSAPSSRERAGPGAAVVGDRVDRHLDGAGPAQRRQRGHRLLAQPRARVVPVDQAGVGAVGDAGQRRVVAVAVEVVEAQHREPEPSGEVGLARARRPGQDNHLSRHVAHHAVAGSGHADPVRPPRGRGAAAAHGVQRRRARRRRPSPRRPPTRTASTSIPDEVFTTLGWVPTADGATSTVRGCHRQAAQGYVEVRRPHRELRPGLRHPRPHRHVWPRRAGRLAGRGRQGLRARPTPPGARTSARPRWSWPRGSSRSSGHRRRALTEHAAGAGSQGRKQLVERTRRAGRLHPDRVPDRLGLQERGHRVELRLGRPVRLGGRRPAYALEVVGGRHLELGGQRARHPRARTGRSR